MIRTPAKDSSVHTVSTPLGPPRTSPSTSTNTDFKLAHLFENIEVKDSDPYQNTDNSEQDEQYDNSNDNNDNNNDNNNDSSDDSDTMTTVHHSQDDRVTIAQGNNDFDLTLFNKIVPQFRGDQPSLKIFIRRCETYLKTLRPTEEETMVSSLIYKLSGKAFRTFEEQEFTEWEDFRKALIDSVDGGKSLTMMLNELTSVKQIRGQSVQDFANIVQDKLSDILEKIKSEHQSSDARHSFKSEYTKVAIRAFKEGLLGPIKARVIASTPRSLEEIIKVAIEEAQFTPKDENFRVNRVDAKDIRAIDSSSNSDPSSYEKPKLFAFQSNWNNPTFQNRSQGQYSNRQYNFRPNNWHRLPNFQRSIWNYPNKNNQINWRNQNFNPPAQSNFRGYKPQYFNNQTRNNQNNFSNNSAYTPNRPVKDQFYRASTQSSQNTLTNNVNPLPKPPRRFNWEDRKNLTCSFCKKSGHAVDTCFSRSRSRNPANPSQGNNVHISLLQSPKNDSYEVGTGRPILSNSAKLN